MISCTVPNLAARVDEVVTLGLSIETLRNQKHMVFILGNDGHGLIQLVLFKDKISNIDEVAHLLPGSAIIVTGKVVRSSQSKTNNLEMQVASVEICSKALDRPIDDNTHIDQRFNLRVVDLKSRRQQLMLKVRSAFENGCRDYITGHMVGFTEIHTPKLMGGASESGAEVFKVKYFETEAFLAQSPQFYKQMAVASGLPGCFEIGPVFRAEQSRSSRHMTEFTGLDVEFAWALKTEDVMYMESQMLEHAFGKLRPFQDEVKELFGVDLPIQPTTRYMTLAAAKDLLGIATTRDIDLSDENERQLYEKLGVDLIFVKDYPISKRPFYHKWDNETGTTHSFDLIFRGIEITTGALREHNLTRLSEQALQKGVRLESIDDYLNNFRYGCPPHGGFGLGIERVVQKLLGLSSVKEAAFVPRDPERLTP